MKEVDAAWLAALVGGEGYLRYRKAKSRVETEKKTYTYYYWRLSLGIEMGEEEWAKRAAKTLRNQLQEGTQWLPGNGGYRLKGLQHSENNQTIPSSIESRGG